jgi:hypothetical protein
MGATTTNHIDIKNRVCYKWCLVIRFKNLEKMAQFIKIV